MADTPTKKRLALYLPFLCVVAWFLPPLFDMGYSWDDREVLVENPAVRDFDIGRILTEDYWAQRGGAGQYRPLALASLALDRKLFGEDPIALHRVGLLLHGLCVLVLALALDRLRPGAFAPALGLLFLHPVAAEQATWIVGRTGSLALGLGGLALYCALGGRLLAAAVCVFLGAHAREDAVIFVPVIALLLPAAERRRWAITGGATLGVWLAVRWLAIGMVLPPVELSWTAPFDSFAHHAGMLLLIDPPRVMSDGLASTGIWRALLPAFLLGCFIAAGRGLRTRNGLVWALLAFLPFAQLVVHGEQVAARYAYPMLPGLALAGLVVMAPSGPRLRAVLALLPLLLAPFWLRQVHVLSDARRTFEQVLAVEPDNARAALALALAEENAGDAAAAVRRFEDLVKRRPRYAKAHVNLGRLLWKRGELARAERVLEDAVARFPNSGRAGLTFGRFLYEQKRYGAAALELEEALVRNPCEGQAARYLCRSLLRLGKRARAAKVLEVARRLDPKHRALIELERLLTSAR
ncbi:MAG: tetratricopeptide repeat protein [Planctomycetota bacterium]|nr:tetratricopeptide repeat protein [Planctomycetota bacterium]